LEFRREGVVKHMQMIKRQQGWGSATGVALLIVAGAGAKAAEGSFSLVITGAEGARYAGRCILMTIAGEETLELSGVVPRHEEFTGQGLSCRIESMSPIAVEITHDGNLSRSVTNGGTVRIAVR
jgi:hypothetical protein